MLREISHPQFLEWQAYYRIEPWGEWRADMRMAQMLSLYANAHRDGNKHPKPFTPADFMPDFAGDHPKTKPHQGKQLREALGHRVVKKGPN